MHGQKGWLGAERGSDELTPVLAQVSGSPRGQWGGGVAVMLVLEGTGAQGSKREAGATPHPWETQWSLEGQGCLRQREQAGPSWHLLVHAPDLRSAVQLNQLPGP